MAIQVKLLQKNAFQRRTSLKEPENQFIVDEVISKDLQMVVDWSAQGVITSAYLKHQEILSRFKF